MSASDLKRTSVANRLKAYRPFKDPNAKDLCALVAAHRALETPLTPSLLRLRAFVRI